MNQGQSKWVESESVRFKEAVGLRSKLDGDRSGQNQSESTGANESLTRIRLTTINIQYGQAVQIGVKYVRRKSKLIANRSSQRRPE